MFDNDVLDVFLEKQGQLFDEPVAQTRQEALEFLEDCMAQVLDSKKELVEYFDELGVDFNEEELLEESEVFDLEDGRFLVVEA